VAPQQVAATPCNGRKGFEVPHQRWQLRLGVCFSARCSSSRRYTRGCASSFWRCAGSPARQPRTAGLSDGSRAARSLRSRDIMSTIRVGARQRQKGAHGRVRANAPALTSCEWTSGSVLTRPRRREPSSCCGTGRLQSEARAVVAQGATRVRARPLRWRLAADLVVTITPEQCSASLCARTSAHTVSCPTARGRAPERIIDQKYCELPAETTTTRQQLALRLIWTTAVVIAIATPRFEDRVT